MFTCKMLYCIVPVRQYRRRLNNLNEVDMLDKIEQLKSLNEELRDIQAAKDYLVLEIHAELNHPENKSKSYQFGDYKVTLKTGRNYKIDVDTYINMALSEDLDPVNVKIKYEVNPKKMGLFEEKHSNLYSQFITWTPSKPALTIEVAK